MKRQAEAILNGLRRTIAEHGHAVQYVAGNPPWGYTIGLTEQGLPELLLFGLNPRDAQWILNQAAKLQADGKLREGAAFSFSEATAPLMPVRVREEELTSEYFNLIRHIYPLSRIRVLQLALSDPQHRFPWSEGVDPKFKTAQKLLGDPPLLN